MPNAFNFKAVDPIVDMVSDNERHILYARTRDMKLQVFDLGENGDGPPKRIAEEKNLIDPHDAQFGLRRATTSRFVSRTARPSIVCFAPLSILESKYLHLVAVLSDGKRLYISTVSSGKRTAQRPQCLKIVASRPSPPLIAGAGLNFGSLPVGGIAQPEDLALKVDTSFYSGGCSVFSDSSSSMSSLLIVNRDSTVQQPLSGSLGVNARGSRALRELVLSLPIEGQMLSMADILPQPETSEAIYSLYSDTEASSFKDLSESFEKATTKLRARGDISMQHILPRRKIVVFSTMCMTEVVFNRPVDILRRLLETNAPRSLLEDFFNRFGVGEAAAMCLMLAARLVSFEENLITNVVSEKAAEAFEDPRLVGKPQLDGSASLLNTRTPGSFSMGQIVQEAEPVFSGAYEGLCLCSSRLLFPIWELPVMNIQGSSDGVIVCRLSSGAIQVLESKFRSLELFLRSRRDKRRGLYGYVASLGDFTGSILYENVGVQSRNAGAGDGLTSNKRQRLPYSHAELYAMEVKNS